MIFGVMSVKLMIEKLTLAPRTKGAEDRKKKQDTDKY